MAVTRQPISLCGEAGVEYVNNPPAFAGLGHLMRPACPVVWEGRSLEVPSYPDF